MSFCDIGKKIKNRRKDLQITQPDLSELAGISVNSLYKIERGVGNPTLEVLRKILDVLGLEMILSIKDPKTQNPDGYAQFASLPK
jgi:y4mF family transcriptional regulator